MHTACILLWVEPDPRLFQHSSRQGTGPFAPVPPEQVAPSTTIRHVPSLGQLPHNLSRSGKETAETRRDMLRPNFNGAGLALTFSPHSVDLHDIIPSQISEAMCFPFLAPPPRVEKKVVLSTTKRRGESDNRSSPADSLNSIFHPIHHTCASANLPVDHPLAVMPDSNTVRPPVKRTLKPAPTPQSHVHSPTPKSEVQFALPGTVPDPGMLMLYS